MVLILAAIQRNKMVVLVVLVIVRLVEQLYLDKEIMLALLLDSARILLLAEEVLILLVGRQLEVCLVVADLAKQAQSADLRLLTQAEEVEVAFLVLPPEQEDLVEAAMVLTALMGLMELLILEVAVAVRGIWQQLDQAERGDLEL